jgi:hypothetical protein
MKVTRALVSGELPAGYIGPDGRCYRDVHFKALTGRDEMALDELPRDTPMSRAVTALVTLAVKRVGHYRMTSDVARSLVPADRDYVLRRLWDTTFSSKVWAVVTCPVCATAMDTEFDLSSVPIEGKPQRPSYVARIDGRDVMFRLPKVSDIENAEPKESEAALALLSRCILSMDGHTGPDENDIAMLPVPSRLAIEDAIERACPDSQLQLEATCPECRQRVPIHWDVAAQFFAALRTASGDLLQHIHLLSLHYHWPLTEILGLTTMARRQYVLLLLSNLSTHSRDGAV